MSDTTKLESLRMCSGQGDLTDNALCVMQMVDYLTTGRTTDRPVCASSVITTFLVAWNDALPSDAERDRLLRPLIADVIGTRTGDEDEAVRS
ncbi:MAG: hypothetical protein SGJ11_07105, partial [Phycisphaerae bacterium]|nr:hypothetical protein [Phycisphaerae bacterium]